MCNENVQRVYNKLKHLSSIILAQLNAYNHGMGRVHDICLLRHLSSLTQLYIELKTSYTLYFKYALVEHELTNLRIIHMLIIVGLYYKKMKQMLQ